MLKQSPGPGNSTKDAGSTPVSDSAPPKLKSEDVSGAHTEKPTDVKEASGPNITPNGQGQSPGSRTALGRLAHILTWSPKNCRYDPNEPPQFSLSLNLLFALVRFTLVPRRRPHR